MMNSDVRQEVKEAGLFLWQIADVLGLHDSGLSRKLRHELPESEKDRIRAAISTLKEGENHV